MVEKDLNRIITFSFRESGGMSHKISDDAGNFMGTSKKPFDWLSVYNGFSYYGESKLLKPLKAFNFSIIEPHQYSALCQIVDQGNPNFSIPVFTIGAWEANKYFYIFVFHASLIRELRDTDINSILRKNLLSLIDKGKYLRVQKGVIDVNSFNGAIVKSIWF